MSSSYYHSLYRNIKDIIYKIIINKKATLLSSLNQKVKFIKGNLKNLRIYLI